MNKLILSISFSMVVLLNWAQNEDAVQQKWQEIHQKNEFRPSRDYTGPERNSSIDPSGIQESQKQVSSGSNEPYQGLPYSDKEIKRGRNGSGSSSGSGGGGTLDNSPAVRPGQSVTTPEVDLPDPNLPKTGFGFWKIIGIIALIVALAYVTYLLIKNRSNSQASVIPFEPLAEDLNPAAIPKTELEMRLEAAFKEENYRECVRIYFLFVMKSLIEQKQLFWKKEKTNLHYIIDLSGNTKQPNFEHIVSIYDIVWYGDYFIDKQTYLQLEPTLKSNYKSIDSAV